MGKPCLTIHVCIDTYKKLLILTPELCASLLFFVPGPLLKSNTAKRSLLGHSRVCHLLYRQVLLRVDTMWGFVENSHPKTKEAINLNMPTVRTPVLGITAVFWVVLLCCYTIQTDEKCARETLLSKATVTLGGQVMTSLMIEECR